MPIKRAYFCLTGGCLFLSILLALLLWICLGVIISGYPTGGVAWELNGEIHTLEYPTPEQARIVDILNAIRMGAWVVLPAMALGIAGIFFYHWKLKTPIALLLDGTQRISRQDLEFSIPEVSQDELGQVCAAFETMRAELLKTNRELWRQAEERKRLNAAFSHDLRNPITVLKGTVKMLSQGSGDSQAIERLGIYTSRIEQYVEAMNSIQRLEQMPVRKEEISLAILRTELQETARLLAPTLKTEVECRQDGNITVDHGILLTVVENLIGNAARFAKQSIKIEVSTSDDSVFLTVIDDGSGFPNQLVRDGPKPFGKLEENAEHFGMGLYSSSVLCAKHGGSLSLHNDLGAVAKASFQLFLKP